MKTLVKLMLAVILVGLILTAQAGAMDKNLLVDYMAMDASMTKADSRKALDAFIKTVSNSMAKGETVAILGFGTFSVVDGPSGKTVHFQPDANLQRRVSLSTNTTTTTPPVACVYTLSGTSQTFEASKGSGSFSISTDNACRWTANTDVRTWMRINSGKNGMGNGMIKFSLAENKTSESREAHITIGEKTFIVVQNGKSATGGRRQSGRTH